MADVRLKIQILKKSIATFTGWLDGCDQLLSNLPSELEQCQPKMLRELALKYKDLLLQMKERCAYIQEVNSLCKEVGNETKVQSSSQGQSSPSSQSSHNPELAVLATEVRDLNTRFTTMCIQAKQHYVDLSNALTTAVDDQASLKSFSFQTISPPLSDGSRGGSRLSDQGNSPIHKSHALTEKEGVANEKELLKNNRSPKSPSNLRAPKSPRGEKKSKMKLKRKRSKSLHFDENDHGPSDNFEIINLDESPKLTRTRSWSVPTDLDDILNQPTSTENTPNGHFPNSSSTHDNMLTSTHQGGFHIYQQSPPSGAMKDPHTRVPPTSDKTVNKQLTGLRNRKEIDSATATEIINRPKLDHSESCDSPVSTQAIPSQFIRARPTDSSLPTSPSGSVRGSKRSKRRPRSAVFVSGSDSTLAKFYYLDEQVPGSPRAITDLETPNCNSPILKLSPGLVESTSTSQNTERKMSITIQRADAVSELIKGQRSFAQSLGDLQRSDVTSLTSPDGFSPRPLVNTHIGSTNQNASVFSDTSSFIGSNLTVSGVDGWGCEGVGSGARRSKSMDELAVVAGGKKEQNLSSRLNDLSFQLQEFVHAIAESRKCSLQSLPLELHLGEVKAMLTILEVQETELTRLRATFSPLAKRKLEQMETLKTVSNTTTFSVDEVASRREEILKLSERVGLLRRHCAESVEQTEEVLEFVVHYEKEFKVLKDFLTSHASNVEVIKKEIEVDPDQSWRKLSEELTTVSEEKPQLKCIHELSVHLLYLEPIFDGSQVRDDLKGLTEKFQNLTMKIFGLLEEQAKLRAEQLLLESSVMSSWITEASLSVQALAKKAKKPNGVKSKLAATRETLTQDLYKHQTCLEAISDKLHPIIAVLNPDETPNLDELVRQVETNRKSLGHIESNLLAINISPPSDNLQINPSDGDLNRSMTMNDVRVKRQPHARSFSDVGVNEQIEILKAKGQMDGSKTLGPRKVKGQNDGHYAEIGNLQKEILNSRRYPIDESLVPSPSLKSGGQRSTGVGGQKGSSLYERVELPSPLMEYDHVPSRPLDDAIEQLPHSHVSSPAPSLPHTPTHSPSHVTQTTPTRRPVVQYVEVDVSFERDPMIKTDQSKSSSVSSLDRLQGQRSPDPAYAEIGIKPRVTPEYAEIGKFRKSSNYAEIKKVTSSPDIRRKPTPKYTEIDIPDLPSAERVNKSTQRVNKKIGKHQKRRRHMSLHEDLLEFIGQEWADLSLKKTTHQAALDEAALDQSLSQLANAELRTMCQRFVRGVREIGAGVQGVMEQISVLKPPETHDLERVHAAIDQCQKLLDRLSKLHPRLDSYNNESLNLIGSLGRTPTCARVSQLIEIRLFEVSTLWYSANLKASTHMHELRSQEGDINYLYRQLQKLSRALKEGSSLLDERKSLTDVDKYLKSCKVMYGKLCDLSDLRGQVASDIRETVAQNPQSSVSQELLDQLQEINTQWTNVAKELSKMPTLEPLLIKLMFTNISAELVTVEMTFKTLEVRVLNVDKAQANCKTCKLQLEKSKLFHSSLKSTNEKLSPSHKAPSTNGHLSDTEHNGSLTGNKISQQDGQTANCVKENSNGSMTDDVRGAEVAGGLLAGGSHSDSNGGGLGLSVMDCSELRDRCETLIQQLDKILTKAERLSVQLQDEFDWIDQFHDELRDLQQWMSDTQDMLQLSEKVSQNSTTSVSQLRGKHQAIFQQIVTRQPKLISVQSLAERLVSLPSNDSEKQLVEEQLADLCTQWDNLCKQIVPAGSLPQVMTPVGNGHRLQFEPPSEFEDVSQMVEWLSLIEFKLQPLPIVVGDVKQIRRSLQDLQTMASEVQSRERDYSRFVGTSTIPASLRSNSICSDFDPELSSTVRSLLGVSTPEGIYQIPTKNVKFHDENTLERKQRHKEITKQIGTENGNVNSGIGASVSEIEESDDATPLASPDGSLTRYHSQGPEAVLWNGASSRSRFGMDLKLTGLEPRKPPRVTSDTSIGEISLTSLSSLGSLVAIPSSPLTDDVYQLVLLWKGVWSSISQQRKRFESTLEIWKNFEMKKEEFCNFLSKAEDRVSSFFTMLSECKDLTVVQTEITSQQMFFKETTSYDQRLSTLNHLSQDLITNHHSNDDTSDLKDMMDDLNTRWKRVMESVSQHQPTVSALLVRWSEFYREYQSYQQWIRNLDTDMSYLNPFVTDMDAVKIQLEKQKEIQHELVSREGGMEAIRLLAYKLLQGVGGCHINATAIHSRLDNLGKRVGHLETLAQERRSALEQALTEKQDFLTHLADTLAWLNQAEKHLTAQKPLGTEFDTVHIQYEAQQTFWKECLEQQPKIKSVIALGNRLANESHWPQGTGEELRGQFGGVAGRWERIWIEGEEWGRVLGGVHPEMEVFQTLCSECGQQLSDAELIAEKFEMVSRKLPFLEKQLAALDIFEANLIAIGNQLEAIVLSQRKQVQLGVKVTSDLYQLVKRFHQRWNLLKRTIDERRVAIQSAQIKYDPANLSTADLPPGWQRSATETGTPYFINTTAGNRTQWEHPHLSTLHTSLQAQHSLPSYPSPAYPVALKLRAIQQTTQLSLLRTRDCMEVYDTHKKDHAHKSSASNHILSFYDMIVITIDMFQKVEEEVEKGEGLVAGDDQFYINSAVEMTTCWIRDVFDMDHSGKVSCMSLQLAAVCLSKGKLDDKYKALFKVLAGGDSSIDLIQVTSFLEQVMMIGQSVSEIPFCSLHAVDVCARECFRKYVGVGRLQLPQFVSWLQTEPPPLSWLPILHRLGASEHAQHEIKCSVCKTQPITGLRYRCVQCSGFDMCQCCYWSGQTGKGHDRTKHFMEEYCVPKPADEAKDFLKTIRKSFRLKKKPFNSDNNQQPHPPPHKLELAKLGGADHTHSGTPVERRWTSIGKGSPSTAKRHTAYVPVHIGDVRRHGNTAHREGGESHPGRRFTVLEDVQSAWRMSAEGVPSKARRASSPPPSVPPASSLGWATHKRNRPLPEVRPRDLEASLSKITQTTRSLSFRLRSLRERQGSPGAREGSPEHEEEALAERDGGRSPTPEDELRRRNAMLQGRVQLLQEHNLRLENCISQLKLISNLQQPTSHSNIRQPSTSQTRPHPLPPPLRTSSGPPPLPSRARTDDTYAVPLSSRLSSADMYDVPPSLPARDYYDTPPSFSNNNLAEEYDVPAGLSKRGIPEVYSVPVRSPKKTNAPDIYSVPTNQEASELYSVPTSRRTSASSDFYDVPLPSLPASRSNTVSRSNTGSSSQYTIPPPAAVLKMSKSAQGSSETYDIPPPRLLSALPNPDIPPPRLPRRINTAPAGAKSSSTLL